MDTITSEKKDKGLTLVIGIRLSRGMMAMLMVALLVVTLGPTAMRAAM